MKKILFVFAVCSYMSLAAQHIPSEILNNPESNPVEATANTVSGNRSLAAAPKTGSSIPKSSTSINTSGFRAAAKPVATGTSVRNNAVDGAEELEFKKLMTVSASAHQQKTVKLLNQLFDNDVMNKEAILLVQNNSDCNMIIRVLGVQSYNLPVAAHGENSVVVKKGSYQLSGNACSAKYASAKSILKNTLVTLNSSAPRASGIKLAQNGNGVPH